MVAAAPRSHIGVVSPLSSRPVGSGRRPRVAFPRTDGDGKSGDHPWVHPRNSRREFLGINLEQVSETGLPRSDAQPGFVEI